MAVQATINPTWQYKWALVSVALFFWGGWCLYDYYIRYPKQDTALKAFRQLQDEGKIKDWPRMAAENGWDEDGPSQDPQLHEEKSDYIAQISMLALAWPCSALAGWWLLSHMGKRITADENALVGPSGEQILYGDITTIDKTRWRSKGFAYIHYGPPENESILKFDDWLYQDIDKVLHEVEARTGITDSTTQTA